MVGVVVRLWLGCEVVLRLACLDLGSGLGSDSGITGRVLLAPTYYLVI